MVIVELIESKLIVGQMSVAPETEELELVNLELLYVMIMSKKKP